MTNPWMKMWIDQVNSVTRGVQDFWLGELQRHQVAYLKEATRQSTQSWFNAWTVLPAEMMNRTMRRF